MIRIIHIPYECSYNQQSIASCGKGFGDQNVVVSLVLSICGMLRRVSYFWIEQNQKRRCHCMCRGRMIY